MSEETKVQFHYGDRVVLNPSITFDKADESMVKTFLEDVRDRRVVGIIEARIKASGEVTGYNIPVRWPGEASLYGFTREELLPAPDAEIARLREQVDTLTRERDTAREALKPFAAAWEAWLRLLETEDEAEFGMHLFYEDIPQLDGHPFEDAYRVVKQADAANVLADGGE